MCVCVCVCVRVRVRVCIIGWICCVDNYYPRGCL